MAAFKCGNCSEQTHFTPSGVGESIDIEVRGRTRYLYQQALRCDMCKRLTMAYHIDNSTPYNPSQPSSWNNFWSKVDKPHMYYPRPTADKKYPNTPAHIAEAASEAYKVHSLEAYRATAILCRAVIEAICKDHKAEGRDLFKKIDNLYDQGLIRLFVKETAHLLRAIGNDMAHGDFEQEFTSDDADNILGFMDSILDEVYESTAKLTMMQNLVVERKDATKSLQ